MTELGGPTFGDPSGGQGDGSTGLSAGESCQGEVRQAERIEVDLLLMLDVSGSMLEELPGLTLLTKWDAVRQSIAAFVQDPGSQAIGVGLQFFPQVQAGVPAECAENDDCGAGGPCSNSQCVQDDVAVLPGGARFTYLRQPDGPVQFCSGDGDCAAADDCRRVVGQCVLPGADGGFINFNTDPTGQPHVPVCADDRDCLSLPGTLCEQVGVCSNVAQLCSESAPCPAAGTCFLIPEVCTNRTLCSGADYAGTAVPITTEAGRVTQIMNALAQQQPDVNSLTPTGPALAGALQQAQSWARTHPGRQVVAVLATDGFPTTCEPLEIPDIAQLAGDALSSAPSVKTFVIGVFSLADLGADGQLRLNQIARAGGTERAFLVNTAGNVAQSFLDALSAIRNTALSCEFQLSTADLDFTRVNMTVTEPGGAVTQLVRVDGVSACAGGAEGWYYVNGASGSPESIEVCPQTCERLQVPDTLAELQIGCATRVR